MIGVICLSPKPLYIRLLSAPKFPKGENSALLLNKTHLILAALCECDAEHTDHVVVLAGSFLPPGPNMSCLWFSPLKEILESAPVT